MPLRVRCRFAVWLAHYLFHFLTGMMTLVPAFQPLPAETLGTDIFGAPDWALAAANHCRPCQSSGHADRHHAVRRQRGVGHGLAHARRAAGKRESFPWLTLLAR
ncbi:MAG: hypothetical protein R3A10_15320 [Caldilineaceae bacterium]